MYGVFTFTCRLPIVNVWCFDLLYLVYVDFLLAMYGVLTFLPVDFLLSMYGVLTFFI